MPFLRLPPAVNSRDFRLYMAGQMVSLTGTWMQSVAQNWLVWSLTNSSIYLGIVAGASSLPMLLFTIPGGIIADRFSKRKILMATQILSIIPALLLGIFIDLRIITVFHIAIFAFLLGSINALDVPTRQSFLIEMVGRESLTSAIALNSAIFNGARLIGPVIAGVIISFFSISTCFYLNAISYIPIILALNMMKSEQRNDSSELWHRKKEGRTLLPEIKEAMDFLRSDPTVFHTLLLVMAFSLFGIPYIILLPVIATEVFSSSAGIYGIMMGAQGAGSLAAALSIALRQEVSNKRMHIGFFTVIFSIVLFFFALSKELFLSLLLLFLAGFCIISLLATANSLIQHRTPDNLRGRIMSIYTLVFLGMAPAGNLLVGSLASVAGAATGLKILSLLTMVGGLVFTVTERYNRD
ncbi:MAG: MFS transporter [Thermodesulfovibrionales bacterium]|nr:MFS transporter [Thermodesulfovibrionales bacterium]